MLSALLGWSQGTFASGIEIAGDKAKIIREVDGGLEHIVVNMPCVITGFRLNEPRYASLPNIMKAKKSRLIAGCSRAGHRYNPAADHNKGRRAGSTQSRHQGRFGNRAGR